MSANSQFIAAIFKFVSGERFCHDVGDDFGCRAVGDLYFVFLNAFAKMVVRNVDMFGSVVVNRISRECDRRLVVLLYDRWTFLGEADFV